MKCRVDERQLALYVEGDLEDRERLSIEAHLKGCKRCRTLRRDLKTSQSALKSLGGASLDEGALARVRRDVLDAIARETVPSTGQPAWVWSLAAAVAVAAIAGFLLWQSEPGPPAPVGPRHFPAPSSEPVEQAPAVPGEMSLSGEAREDPEALRGPRGAVPEQPGQEQGTGRRQASTRPAPPSGSTVTAPPTVSRKQEVPEAVHRLSPRDADQLTRALVALSRIQALPATLDDVAPEPGATDRTVVRLTTADPDVIIYWQIDSNGG
jgi:hypothetical protein